MTAPVVQGFGPSQKLAMTAPVLQSGSADQRRRCGRLCGGLCPAGGNDSGNCPGPVRSEGQDPDRARVLRGREGVLRRRLGSGAFERRNLELQAALTLAGLRAVGPAPVRPL